MRLAPGALLLSAVIIWGWTFVATKICLEYLSPVELLALRLVIALPVLLALCLQRRIRLDLLRRPLAAAPGAVLITLHFLIQITGLQSTTATHTGWIICVSPLVLALLSLALLRERPPRRLWAGLVVASVGILFLVSHGRPGDLTWLRSTGDWLVLASALTWALYTISVRDLTRNDSPLAVTLAVLAPPGLLLGCWLVIRAEWGGIAALPLDAWIALIFLGIFGMALAQAAWQAGVAAVGAAQAGMFLYVEPLATMALAVPLLGEPFGPSVWFGGGLVLAGVWLSQLRRKALRDDAA